MIRGLWRMEFPWRRKGIWNFREVESDFTTIEALGGDAGLKVSLWKEILRVEFSFKGRYFEFLQFKIFRH